MKSVAIYLVILCSLWLEVMNAQSPPGDSGVMQQSRDKGMEDESGGTMQHSGDKGMGEESGGTMQHSGDKGMKDELDDDSPMQQSGETGDRGMEDESGGGDMGGHMGGHMGQMGHMGHMSHMSHMGHSRDRGMGDESGDGGHGADQIGPDGLPPPHPFSRCEVYGIVALLSTLLLINICCSGCTNCRKSRKSKQAHLKRVATNEGTDVYCLKDTPVSPV